MFGSPHIMILSKSLWNFCCEKDNLEAELSQKPSGYLYTASIIIILLIIWIKPPHILKSISKDNTRDIGFISFVKWLFTKIATQNDIHTNKFTDSEISILHQCSEKHIHNMLFLFI